MDLLATPQHLLHAAPLSAAVRRRPVFVAQQSVFAVQRRPVFVRWSAVLPSQHPALALPLLVNSPPTRLMLLAALW
ncbi:MAG: hypothetical protein EBQ89_09025, partial [Alphaproteobacteria bacterium]|nr:hypothetical protein [Alphaproteobacteria bacterium]